MIASSVYSHNGGGVPIRRSVSVDKANKNQHIGRVDPAITRRKYLGRIIQAEIVDLGRKCNAVAPGTQKDFTAMLSRVAHSLKGELDAEGDSGELHSPVPLTSQSLSNLIAHCGIVRKVVFEHLQDRIPEFSLQDAFLIDQAIDVQAIASLFPSPKSFQDMHKEKLCVLLVEDTRTTRELLIAALDHSKYSIQVAVNGQEALELFAQKQFEFVLTDIQMPVLDGLTATRRMREIEAKDTSRRPAAIIVITAGAAGTDQAAVLRAGANAYMSKPIDFQKLFGLLDSLLFQKELTIAVESDNQLPITNSKTFNLETSLNRLQRDLELFHSLVEFFVDDHKELLDELSLGVMSNDLNLTRSAAHTIKGMASSFDAQEVVELALQLEQLARSGHLEKAAEPLQKLKDALSELVDELQPYYRSTA